ncbi:redoxin family protein [Helicobacter himalayensis]|uniref:redoxin family protein n=1 Tax=Helicobacter himalayensis TaxID=1591088 RepID=UPI003D6FCCFC
MKKWLIFLILLALLVILGAYFFTHTQIKQAPQTNTQDSQTLLSLDDIALLDFQSQPTKLSTLANSKKIYLIAWASWCPYCLASLEELDFLAKEQNDDFIVLSVVSPNQRGEKEMSNFKEWFEGLEYKNLIVLFDTQGAILKRAKIFGYPTHLFLDSQANVRHISPGAMNSERAKEILREI